MSGETTSSQGVVQSGMEAIRLKGVAVKKAFAVGGVSQHILLLHAKSLMAQISQTADCNRLHSVEQQPCRSLLINHDQMQTERLVMSHNLIADMLGVRRWASLNMSAAR